MNQYLHNALICSKVTTGNYSTSFSLGTRLINKKFRMAIYAIYGYVRYADEIVDTLFGFPQKELLDDFRIKTYQAIRERISTNPILHSFQWVVNTYDIPYELIEIFLNSMEEDLNPQPHSEESFKKYIYGSAEVIGLMCLKVFTNHHTKDFNNLKHPAQKLGKAFQKVNFLRDLGEDFKLRGRAYFPDITLQSLTKNQKDHLVQDIKKDFQLASLGIARLPKEARFGVFVAYQYYLNLLWKTEKTSIEALIQKRIRISNLKKILLLLKSYLQFPMFLKKQKKTPLPLHLKISLDPHSGFCFGAQAAIDKAESLLQDNGKLYCLGQIVHNDMEIERLEKLGLKTINLNQLKELKNTTVLIRAHGEPPTTFNLASQQNIQLIDATCPIISSIHKKVAQAAGNGENILIYGNHNHPEVLGLLGHSQNKARVFSHPDQLREINLPREITLFSQTTKDPKGYEKSIEYLYQKGIHLKIHRTICNKIDKRVEELGDFASQHDCILFAAGKRSSNGKVLFETCKQVNPRCHYISSLKELKREWFSPEDKVGICGATSTPHWFMCSLQNILEDW